MNGRRYSFHSGRTRYQKPRSEDKKIRYERYEDDGKMRVMIVKEIWVFTEGKSGKSSRDQLAYWADVYF
jgi:hypothetical protein